MVFLRLSVKVFPRDQLASNSSSSWGRSLPFTRKSVNDDSSQASAASATSKKPGIFLLVLEKPEDVTLGGLAGMIQDHWAKLHPDLEPLTIKKILDDTKEDLDLYPDLTVADVWVDYGKARADGLDQRGTVRVVQKPAAAAAPERFPSVDQDWDAAIVAYERQRDSKIKKDVIKRRFSPIQEEDESQSIHSVPSHRSSQTPWSVSPGHSGHDTQNQHHIHNGISEEQRRRRDVPLSSVEVHSPTAQHESAAVNGPTIAGTPPPRRDESEELGESPSPAERRRSSTRARSTPASATATSPKSNGRLGKIARPRVPATRTITKIPDDAEPAESSQQSAEAPAVPEQKDKEQIEESSNEASESESAEDNNVTPPPKPSVKRTSVGPQPESRLSALAKSISKSPQQKPSDQAIPISSAEESEDSDDDSDDSDEESDKESDKNETAKSPAKPVGVENPEDKPAQNENDDLSEESSSSSSSSSDSSSSESGDNEEYAAEDTIAEIQLTANRTQEADKDGDVQMEGSQTTVSPQASQMNGASGETRSRKRKQSPDGPVSVKETRINQAHPSTRQQTKFRSPSVVISSQHTEDQSKSKSPIGSAEIPLPPQLVSPRRRHERVPSFSSPARRRASISKDREQSPNPTKGLGLGITASPPNGFDNGFGGPLLPSSVPTAADSVDMTPGARQTPALDRTKKLHSAIRGKDSPSERGERRSVSFQEGDNIFLTSDPALPTTSTPRATTMKSQPARPPTAANKIIGSGTQSGLDPRGTPKDKEAQKTPTSAEPPKQTANGTRSNATKAASKGKAAQKTPASKSSQGTPSSSQSHTVYPPGFSAESISKMSAQIEQDTQEKHELEERLKASNADPQILILATEMLGLINNLETKKRQGTKRMESWRTKLDQMREQLKTCEEKKRQQDENPKQSVARTPRPTLKGLLSSQRQEMAAKTAKSRPEPKPAPPPRGDVYDVPSSSESESSDSDSDSDSDESESDQGDILPDGSHEKLRKPWSQRNK
ncbi:hypothetical protein N7499_001165 [Penicillium canescens]|uniref:Nucleolar protein Dnt1-like N-terminal domain-containing protein n=1 Tax=Penicillium canescens TaxID=5083 RepID=A0AAD6I2P7_PENCN|nr:uncharacterized protein N7446_003696 [Penicillium canescens]KAJ6027707.1 hypothetical protein N7460_012524 [Penicillium canescens]KAJ6040987.1 hypothetical protein N7444_009892 [Penicillium canescens]KAJ6066659.1 hypothetical protein N7446_003696 [Penicillium canescens]KAJ6101535.1 hypothetical protein N7499_001165 [Penicillium canescens]